MIFKLRNQHYDHQDTSVGSPVVRYFIRTPTIVFPTYSLVETARIAFLPATNNFELKLTAYHDNFRFSRSMQRTFVSNDTVFEIEFGLGITAKDITFDINIAFATHTGTIPAQDVLLEKQNNSGIFEPLYIEVIFEPGEKV